MTSMLADCLLRRKELQDKLEGLSNIKAKDLFDIKVKRMNVSESIDDVTMTVPKLEYNQVVAEYNYTASQLRKIDAAIQRCNWTTEVAGVDDLFVNYEDRK